MRTYGGLSRFVVCEGQPVVDALRALESRQVNFTTYNLRGLEVLVTPESRKEIMMILPEVKKVADLEKAIQVAKHRQWATWVWRSHPNIDESKRMSNTH